MPPPMPMMPGFGEMNPDMMMYAGMMGFDPSMMPPGMYGQPPMMDMMGGGFMGGMPNPYMQQPGGAPMMGSFE